MRLNRRGFTLVEMLAVVVILGLLIGIMVPSVNSLINKNKEDSLKSLENNIRSAAKSYFSDYRYEVVISNDNCVNDVKDVISINNVELNSSRLFLNTLVDEGYLKADNGNIKNPKTSQIINLKGSYIVVQYSCSKKDYIYGDVTLVN